MNHSEDDVVQALSRIELRLASLERWSRFSNVEKLRDIFAGELTDSRKRLVYEYSDGSRGYRDVGKVAGVAGTTVQSWWDRWLAMGIMEPCQSRAGRVQRICSLREVGLDVPPIPGGPADKTTPSDTISKGEKQTQ